MLRESPEGSSHVTDECDPGASEVETESVPSAGGVSAALESSVFGVIPRGASHWRLSQQVAGGWSRCEHSAGGEVVVSEWPLSELSLPVIRSRWGAGSYRVTWIASQPRRRVCGTGRVFTLRPPPPPPPRPAAPPPPPPAQSFGQVVPALGASPQGLVGALALMGAGGGESGSLAQSLMLLQVLHGMAQAQSDATIARERLALERDRERDRERAEEQRAFFRELAAMQSRGGAAQSAAISKLSSRMEELGERFEDLDEAMASAAGGAAGGESGGVAALLPLLLSAVNAKKDGGA